MFFVCLFVCCGVVVVFCGFVVVVVVWGGSRTMTMMSVSFMVFNVHRKLFRFNRDWGSRDLEVGCLIPKVVRSKRV